MILFYKKVEEHNNEVGLRV